MRSSKLIYCEAIGALMFIGGLCVTPISASAGTTYASVKGATSANCLTPSAPCKTIGAALSKAVAAGGYARVVLVGDGVFDEAVLITADSEIVGDGGYAAIAPPSGSVAITVNVSGSGGARIANLQILGSSGAASDGVKVIAGRGVYLDGVYIQGFGNAGVEVATTTPAHPIVSIANSVISGGASCMVVHPSVNTDSTTILDKTMLRGCGANGLVVDGSLGPSGVNIFVDVKRSAIEDPSTLVQAETLSGSGNIITTIEDSALTNANIGVAASGPSTTVILNRATIQMTGAGVSMSGGAVVYSFGDNNMAWAAGVSGGSLTPVGQR